MEQINWYKIFYYISMADGVKHFFDVFSGWFTGFSIISGIAMLIMYITINATDNYDNTERTLKMKTIFRPTSYFFYFSFVMCLITWFGYVALPNKKDSMVIIAGGAVGTFITSDSSARQLPSEALLLLRTKMRSEISELTTETVKDTLQELSKEELIKLLKDKK